MRTPVAIALKFPSHICILLIDLAARTHDGADVRASAKSCKGGQSPGQSEACPEILASLGLEYGRYC